MAIKRSPSAEIRALIEALSADDPITREAAIARLAVLGGRAVDRLLAAYAATTTTAIHIAVLRVFEATAEPRALPIARGALAVGSHVTLPAIGVLRALLQSTADGVGAQALDALMTILLNRSTDRRVRVAALEALRDAPADVHERIAAALAEDPDLVSATRPLTGRDAEMDAVWADAVQGHLGTEPQALRAAVQRGAASAPLGDMQKLIELVRAREAALGEGSAAGAWRSLRGSLHQALALRGSTVAVYDLRETIERAAEPLPSSFVAALHAVGDASCLEPIAAAFVHAADERWRHQLADAFHAIVKRERLSRRHAVVKRIETRWPDATRALSTPSRTRPPQTTPGRTSRRSR